jgi:hypothetical protein
MNAPQRYEVALLDGSFARYCVHRLRGVGLASVFNFFAHFFELRYFFVLFLSGMPTETARIKLVLATLLGAEWGLLEMLRRHMREGRKEQLEPWLAASLALALGTLPLVVWFSRGPLYPATAYLVVLFGRFALELPLRVLHSGIYAFGRVYRPLALVPALEAVTIAVLYFTHEAYAPFALVLAMLGSSLVGQGITLTFIVRQYRLRAVPLPRVKLRSIKRLRIGASGFPALLAGLGLRFSEAFVLLTPLARLLQNDETFMALYVIAPLVGASTSWVHAFYPDLIRCAAPRLALLRRRFITRLAVAGVIGSLAMWSLGAICFWWIQFSLIQALWLRLLPSFVVLPLFALWQLERFTAGAFWRVATSGFVCLAGVWIIEDFSWVWVAPLTALGVGLLLPRRPRLTHGQMDPRTLAAALHRSRRRYDVHLVRAHATHAQMTAALRSDYTWVRAEKDACLIVSERAVATSELVLRFGGLMSRHSIETLDGSDAGRRVLALCVSAPPAQAPAGSIVLDLCKRRMPKAFAALPRVDKNAILRGALGQTPRGFPYTVRTKLSEGLLRFIVIKPSAKARE